MKAALLFVATFFLQAFIVSAQTQDEREIRQLLQAQVVTWNKADLNGFMRGYWNSDSLKFVGKSGITYGYKNTLENYRRNYSDAAKMGKLSFDVLQVQLLSGEYSFVTGKWYLHRAAGDVGGMYTLLFRKIQGKWLIICDHSS